MTHSIDFEIRNIDHEAREVSGIAVPFDQTISVGGFQEKFERGAIQSVTDVKLFWNHQEVIGKVTRGEETENGYEITARISETARGNEAYTLLKDGVIDKFSVGFVPVTDRRDGDVTVRTAVNLKEVSLVPFPAYAGATVSQIRSSETESTEKENNIMTEDNVVRSEDLNEVRETVADLERRIAVAAEKGTERSESKFNSGGEWLKALDRGDAEARMEARAYTGGTFADNDNATRPGWVNAELKLVDEKRPVLNLFRKGTLPSSGMSVEYPQVTGVSGTVGVQAAEGDDLPYTEVTVGAATAPIKTYGGYTSLSRQEIERTEVGMLEVNLRHLYNQYAKATEAGVRSAFVGATGVNTGTLGGDTAEDWLDIVVDSAALIEDNSKGAAAEFVLVSRDVYKRIVHMVDSTGRPLFAVNGDGSNTIGGVSARNSAASIAGFPVVVGAALPANSLFVASSEALTVFEDPAKFLQDENIINLTKDFSVYGYLAVAVTNPLAIVKVDADLA